MLKYYDKPHLGGDASIVAASCPHVTLLLYNSHLLQYSYVSCRSFAVRAHKSTEKTTAIKSEPRQSCDNACTGHRQPFMDLAQ